MTTEEIRDLAAQVKELIAAQARDLSQYEEVTDISQVSTLPGLKGTGTAATLVRVAMKLLKGADGKTPELRADGTNLLWRSEGDGQWQTLCSLEALRGAKVQLRKGGTGIEWKYDNTTEWMTLIPVDELAFKYDDLTQQQKQELTRKPVLSAVDAEKGDEPAGQFTADGEDSAGNPKYRLQLTLPKGDKGDAFTYDDFTPEQIEQLQKPATDIAASVAEAEESRVKNEESRISAEAARAEAENKRASAETARASAETARAEAEASRASAEAKRESAESARAAEEAGRAEAEQGRAEAEQARVTAELQRATAEDTRNTAETARNSAESARAAAETERMHEEALRAQSEAARAGAEESRTEAEESRVKNEELRNTAESARADAEQDRQTAEAARAEAEQGRAGAEESRVTAETARAEAETRRNEELGRLTAECEAATEGVDEAKAEALAAAETARNLPKIEGGTWRVYDSVSGQYLDSGVGATGRSPKIEGGTWWTWDDATGDYQDTGVSVSSQYVLTKEAVEQVLTGDIASHSHDAQMEEKLAPYAKTQDVDEKIAAAAPTKEKIEAALTGDITSHNHNTQITQALQPYAKSTDVTAQLAAALEQYVTNAALSAALEAYKLTKAKIEEALTGDITSHNHTTQVTQALAPYAKTQDVDSKLTAYAKTQDVNSKVSAAEAKIPTKLSQLQNDNHTVQDAAYVHTDQNFTAALKQKLDGLANYNDSALRSLISAAQAKADKAQANLDKLVSGDASTAIDTFNEIEAFLKGVTDTETLTGLLAQQKSEITADAAAKYQPKGSYAAASHNHDDRYPTKTGSGASGTWPVSISGNAATASKLQTPRTITLGQDSTGSVNFDGSGNVTLNERNKYVVGDRSEKVAVSAAQNVAAYTGGTGFSSWAFGTSRDTNKSYIGVLKPSAAALNISAHGTILCLGNGDTHMYIAMDYNLANVRVGAGNADKINWQKQLAFTDSNVSSATKAADSDKLGGKAASEYALKSEVPDTSQFVVDPNYVHTDNNFTNDEKEILSILGANVRLEFNVIINLTLSNYDNYENYKDLGAAVYVNGEQQKLIRSYEDNYSSCLYEFENPPSFHRNWAEPITVKLVVRYAVNSIYSNWTVYENDPTETTVKVTDSDVKITESVLHFNSMHTIALKLSESDVEKYRLF